LDGSQLKVENRIEQAKKNKPTAIVMVKRWFIAAVKCMKYARNDCHYIGGLFEPTFYWRMVEYWFRG
jgi:hypothetical protein